MLGVGVGIGVSNIRRDLPIPNKSDIIRYFKTQEDNTLIDKFGNDAQKILPVSTILATSIAEFSDLSGITITSYSGDQLLSISGNNIISSGTGFVFDLLLSDSTFIPFLHLKTDVSGNENHILNITDIGKEYRLIGSFYLQDKGVVERNPELINGLDTFNHIGGVIDVGENYFETDAVGGIYSDILQPNTTYKLIADFETDDSFDIRYGNTSFAMTILTDASGSFTFTTGADQVRLYLRNAAAGTTSFSYFSVKLATPEIIPNTPEGLPAYPIVSGDTFIAGGGMMNLTDCLVRLYEVGDTDPAKLFFDLSNTLIWNDRARQDYYDTNNTGDIHTSILKQAELYLTFEAAYKYRLWSKINSNGVFKDIFLYANQLQGENICLAKRYVGVGEIYTTIEDDTLICRNDIIE